MRLPRTLFGRTVLVLAACLLLSQLSTQIVNFFDRGSSLYQLNASQISSRIARTARLLNRLPADARSAVAQELGGSDLRIELASQPIEIEDGFDELDEYERAFAAAIRDEMTPPLLTTVEITRAARAQSPEEVEPPSANALEQWIARRFYFMLPALFSVVAQVELQDGSTAAFFVRMPQEPLSQFESLIPKVLMWTVIVFLLSAVIARMMTSPLRSLDRAVTNIGANPSGSTDPVMLDPGRGPVELQRVIQSFNGAQERIRRYLIERSSLLAAISHDLRTPITRMRLRAEMLPEQHRAKFIDDLGEMEELVGSSLDLFKELGNGAERRPVDLGTLVETVGEDWADMGRPVRVAPSAARVVYPTDPSLLKRCVNNLVSNALRYAGDATIHLSCTPGAVVIGIRDHGPGISEADLERVMEPFVRLEPSRNRRSGGTGIGLAIARNIAQWHGGDLRLRNATDGGGLVAEIILPYPARRAGPDAVAAQGAELSPWAPTAVRGTPTRVPTAVPTPAARAIAAQAGDPDNASNPPPHGR